MRPSRHLRLPRGLFGKNRTSATCVRSAGTGSTGEERVSRSRFGRAHGVASRNRTDEQRSCNPRPSHSAIATLRYGADGENRTHSRLLGRQRPHLEDTRSGVAFYSSPYAGAERIELPRCGVGIRAGAMPVAPLALRTGLEPVSVGRQPTRDPVASRSNAASSRGVEPRLPV